MSARRYLFYVSLNYSFEILRPLQREILARGDTVKWLAVGDEINHAYFTSQDEVIGTLAEAVSYQPDACFVPGNMIPSFIPGLKVQVFHGLEWKKNGDFGIRGCFDLYCTHGEATTVRFQQLAQQHGYFDVVETGWPKLDELFVAKPYQGFAGHKPVILYAPTFSPSLTSALALFEQIEILSQQQDWRWLIKFHPKMDPQWIAKYESLHNDNLKVVETSNINGLLQVADIMVSDTSSVIGEFSLLGKAVVTLNNSQPGDYLVNITDPEQLSSAISEALAPTDDLLQAISRYAEQLHPYNDGQSSARILDAVEAIQVNGKQSHSVKPLNLMRDLKQRWRLGYWKL